MTASNFQGCWSSKQACRTPTCKGSCLDLLSLVWLIIVLMLLSQVRPNQTNGISIGIDEPSSEERAEDDDSERAAANAGSYGDAGGS
jgi:hypothetical protein